MTFFTTATAGLEAHRHQLHNLMGRTLHTSWVGWDIEKDVWIPTAPVILRIGSTQLELLASGMDQFSITYNTLNITQAQWKESPFPALRFVRNFVLEYIHLTEYTANPQLIREPSSVAITEPPTFNMSGIEFTLSGGFLGIINARGENAVINHPYEGADYRRTRI